jgi:acyl-CoA hydrolase
MPQNLNPANRLFGGQMMAWIDEAAALYVMSQLRTKSIVTVTVSNLTFETPVLNGDVLEFHCSTAKVGTTSVDVLVEVKKLDVGSQETKNVVTCNIKFVNIGENGKPQPHRLREIAGQIYKVE